MKHAIRFLVLLALLLLIWYLLADRATPFTGNARVKMVVTPIVPQVSGQVIELSAQNGRIVAAGDSLARIDPTPFEIARDTAKADLATVLQELGAGSAGVEGAQASLARAQTDLKNIQLQSARVFEMERKGLVAVARGDDARATLAAAESALETAQADLNRARSQLGPKDEENPAVRRALAALAKAELELSWTELVAPATGGISNLDIAPGAYALAGQPLMRFLDSENVWIEAYMTENNLGNMQPGARVEVVLDMHPGRVLTGVVESFYGAVSIGGPATDGLSSPPRNSGWMRDPQRFPVRILLPGYVHGDAEDDVFFQLNGQADVIVYSSENTVLNMLGSWYIRAMSWLSYAY